MTRSNRMLNRVILLLLGLIALVVAAALAVPLLPPGSVPQVILDVTRPATLLRLAPATTLEWIAAAIAAIAIVLAIAWIVTRGRGRPRTAIDGDLGVDTRVVDELLKDALADEPDVVAGGATGYLVRGRPVLRVHVEARRGADLRRLTDAVHAAVTDLDTALGTEAADRLPVVVHVTSGLRASLAREHRVA
jgi:hypothetical protein